MHKIVKVTRGGRIIIPKEFRRKYGIRGGDELLMEEEDRKIVIRLIRKLEDMAGIYAGYGESKELKAEIERLRNEY